jgi:hypothetical protein
MVFETIYLLRERVLSVAQSEVQIPIKSLKDVIFRELLEEDSVAIYPSEKELDEDLKTLQEMSFLTISGDMVVINRESFLNATKFVERLEELLKDDKYATALFAKLKQRAQRIQVLQQESTQ